MSDIKFYHSYVAPIEERGVSDAATIAALITARSDRYPSVPMTVNEIAVALTDSGNPDADGIVTRLMDSLELAAAGSFLVKNKLAEVKNVDNPGTVDVGSFLQRSMLQKFAANADLSVSQSDVDALLALAEVPAPVTVEVVTAALDAKATADATLAVRAERQEREGELETTYQDVVASVMKGTPPPTREQIAVALEAQATAMRAL